MAINTSSVVSNVYAQSYSASSKSTTKTTKQDETTEVKKEEKTKESQNLGRTIGEPKLSKEAQKYYDKLKKKFEAMVKRDLYTKYKTVPTEEEREKARQEYLEKVGMHQSFRW